MPVRQAIEQGLDILIDNLAGVILAVQKETGVDEDEVEDGMGGLEEPVLPPNGNGDYGGQGGYGGWNGGMNGGSHGGGAPPAWAGSGMSPLRR